MNIRRIVQGLVVAQKQGIDFIKLKENLSAEEISDKLQQLGNARHEV